MSTVTAITNQFSNSNLPYSWARFDCGHGTSSKLVPYRGQCLRCPDSPEVEMKPIGQATTCETCGGQGWTITFMPRPHNPEHVVTAVGDQLDCEECAKEASGLEWLRNLDVSQVHHARLRTGFNLYFFYKLDHTSPSCFSPIGCVKQTPAVDELLRTLRISPLSPTEAA